MRLSNPPLVAVAAGLALAGSLLPGAAGAASARPLTVVELFTSQGCSSCPPANANLIELSKRPDILPLSFAVTYWDYLGWKDTFDRPEYTDRQVAYEPPLGQTGPYTPQMVVNGRSTIVGNRLAEIDQAISSVEPLAGPNVSISATAVTIATAPKPAAAADVWLVRYDPNLVEVPVGRGENTGHTLPHTHVVHQLARLGTWDGAAARFQLASAPTGLKTAILVQEPSGGPILGAATD